MPVLVGWAAVTDSLAWTPVVLFAIIFVWTPPHFWALAVKYRDDYAAADVPMLPVVATFGRTARQIVAYSVAPGRRVAAAGRGGHARRRLRGRRLGARAWCSSRWPCELWMRATPKAAMRLFSYSITYLTLLFVLMAVDIFTKH